jgi:glyoxylase-like metal-dependent hydrolase (beta-lactamase superfamily II)
MSVITIDCNYIEKNIAAAFLMIEGEEGAFIENNTAHSVPILLSELEKNSINKENVKYLIITHVHLDHAGGTSELLKYCPNAIVLAHPKAAPHIIDPKRLIDSSISVYGKEKFYSLYGDIQPVASEKVRIMQDGEELKFGERTLKFIYTRGHANHHFVIHDSKTNGIFTGDSFGIGYLNIQKGNKPFLFPSTTPTDFNAEEAKLSVNKILETGAEKAYLTHFGEWNHMKEGAEQLLSSIEIMESIRLSAIKSELKDDELQFYCEEKIKEFMKQEVEKRNLPVSINEYLKFDCDINAMGLAFSAKKERKKKTNAPTL